MPNILFVLTSHGFFLDGVHPTGWYLPECAHPYYAVTKAGHSVTFASPKGGKSPLDPSSVEAFKADPECIEFLADAKIQDALAHSHKLSDLNEADYAAIFYVGGHGPCFDLAVDPVSIALGEKFFASGKPLAAVCHGPAALSGMKGPDGNSVFNGRNVTSFSNIEEEQVGLTKAIPFLVETDIVAKGGKFQQTRAAWGVEVVVDKTAGLTLITGGNPASATATGEAIVAALKA